MRVYFAKKVFLNWAAKTRSIKFMANKISSVLAECNDVVLLKEEECLIFAQRPQSISPSLFFVAILVTCITGVNAVAQLAMAHGAAALTLTATTCLFAWLLFRMIKLNREAKLQAASPQWVLDRAQNYLLDSRGQKIAPLHELYFAQTFQWNSSSRALTCFWKQDSAIVARGNPFGNSVDDVITALQHAGFLIKS